MGRRPSEASVITPVGHFSGVDLARERMGVPWMTQGEIAQAIPPAYAEYVWRQLVPLLIKAR